MPKHNTNDAMMEMFIFETSQQVELLEQSILTSDEENCYTETAINEIFRIMHTIKGSSSMMMFHGIADLAHTIEDLFFYLREEKPKQIDCGSLTDLILDSVDIIKVEVMKIKNNDEVDGDSSKLIETLKQFLANLKMSNTDNVVVEQQETNCEYNNFFVNDNQIGHYCNTYKAVVFFEEGCEMENVRAYTVIHKLKDITDCYAFYPGDILDSDKSIDVIRNKGFQIYLKTNLSFEEVQDFFEQTIYLKNLDLVQLEEDIFTKKLMSKEPYIHPNNCSNAFNLNEESVVDRKTIGKEKQLKSSRQSIISVSVEKLDKLMDLVGEMVIAEAMVTQNPDLHGLELNNFQKAAIQLNKITTEIQDVVMAVRMVPISTTFHKMNRIVRDMSKNLHKDVQLMIEGEETEVDKNIIEHISDPLMHLVRNALDHGIETPELRQGKGKQTKGTITLKAENNGNDVLIVVKDDGKGLNKESVLKKANENNLLTNNELNMTDTEIYNLVLLPGFSTKENVTEYSGRGVGMDVVTKNIEAISGSVLIDSIPDRGTTVTLKIPLTLATIDGMNIKVGTSRYTIPTMSIKEFFCPKTEDVIVVDIQNLSIGLIVDSVSEVLTIPDQDIVDPPQMNKDFNNRYIKKIGKTGTDVKLLLDCEKLLTEDEFMTLNETI
ncbi:MAG: chemotaxis protein CheA [Clostridiales bacterium]|nr:chemotaxis protein CheA [Clostridiales bacterium]